MFFLQQKADIVTQLYVKNTRWWSDDRCAGQRSPWSSPETLFSRQCGELFQSLPQYQTVNIFSCVYIELGHLLRVTTPFNFLYVTHFLRGGLERLQCTDTITLVHHRWGSVSTAPLRVRGVFCSDSWSWSRAFTLTMAGSARMRKSLKWGRDLWPVCDGELAWFQHFNTPKDRKTD